MRLLSSLEKLSKGSDSNEIYLDVVTKFRAQCEPLVKAGVDLIIPGGGIPMLLFTKENNFEINGAPVVNGLPISY